LKRQQLVLQASIEIQGIGHLVNHLGF